MNKLGFHPVSDPSELDLRHALFHEGGRAVDRRHHSSSVTTSSSSHRIGPEPNSGSRTHYVSAGLLRAGQRRRTGAKD
jgi:hypothetical protein